MNERLWTLLGSCDSSSRTWRITLHNMVIGDQTRVEADWSWTLAREEMHGDVMGFYHTHPDGGSLAPSQRDIRTMQAWCSALGKPLLCMIAGHQKSEIPKGYVFKTDEHRGEPVDSITREAAGTFVVKES